MVTMLARTFFTGLLSLSFVGYVFAQWNNYAPNSKSILMHNATVGAERDIAMNAPLGYTVVVMGDAQWATLVTAEVASYRAVVFGDPNYTDLSPVAVPTANRVIWSQAIKGNVIVIGTDPADPLHLFGSNGQGARTLMERGIAFAADGQETGLYLCLSQYYDTSNPTSVVILDQFGDFRVRGNLNCYNKAHKIVVGTVLDGLTDDSMSNWSCSVHEIFLSFPSDFSPLAIAQDFDDPSKKTYPDNTTGIPYIVSRGATPVRCGDGRLDPGEECDDGNLIDGDGCNKICKKEPPPTNPGNNCTCPCPPSGGGPGPGPGKCELCDPSPLGTAKCDITAPCSNTPYGTMCGCRPGYRADYPGDMTDKHWRLSWGVPGHEHRVYVAPGVKCDTLCDKWYLGPEACQEVAVKQCK